MSDRVAVSERSIASSLRVVGGRNHNLFLGDLSPVDLPFYHLRGGVIGRFVRRVSAATNDSETVKEVRARNEAGKKSVYGLSNRVSWGNVFRQRDRAAVADNKHHSQCWRSA